MIEMIKAEPWHLHSLSVTVQDPNNQIMKIENFLQVCTLGDSVTLMENGLPIGASGVVPVWPGVGELWALFSLSLRERPLLLYKQTLKALNQFQAGGNYHRLQAIVLKDFEASKRWLIHLQFQCEGLLREYGEDRQDYYRFARIF